MNQSPATRRRRSPVRRGFNLVELLIALAISAALLTATMVALDASFRAYQMTTEVASTHTIGRLTMNRILTLIRTGEEFGPYPVNPVDTVVESDSMEFITPDDRVMTIEWRADSEALWVTVTPPGGGTATEHLLLEGVIAQYDPPGSTNDVDRIRPFTLEYELGRRLYRATVDLMIQPDDNMDVELDGDSTDMIHLVASAMPRIEAYDP